MATWFATGTGNINTAGRWNSAPGGGGSTLTWPPNAADVLVTNGFTITVNVSVTVAEYRNGTTGGASNGGQFQVSANNITMTGNVYGDGNASCIRSIITSGTFNVVGTVNGGASATGLFSSATGSPTINITGAITGGSGSGGYGASFSTGTPTVNITGDVVGGSYASTGQLAMGIRNAGGATINITGNVIANADYAIGNEVGGSVTISGYAQASATFPALLNSAQGVVQVGETRSASNGRGPMAGPFRYASATAAKTMPYTPDGQISMTVLDVAAIVPAVGNVQKGLVYGDGAYTGTYIPPAGKRINMTRMG